MMSARVGNFIGLVVLLGVGLSACATDGTLGLPAPEPKPYPPPGYVHRVASSHVELYWNCTHPEPGILRLEGVAVNPWNSQDIRFLEFDLVGVDARERTAADAQGQARDFLLGTNQSTPFQLDLRTTGAEVRFDLFYQYRFQENGGRFLAASSAAAPRLLAQTQRFMARDVCSETQHRIR